MTEEIRYIANLQRQEEFDNEVTELKDALKRLEQENKSLYEEKNCLHKIIDRLLENAGYSKDIASAEDFEDVYEDMQIKRNELIELEQENKELKNIIKIHDSTKYDYYKLMKENEEWHIKYAGCNTANIAIQEENKKYRSALEEIREDIKCFYSFEDSSNDYQLVTIIDKINEVIG